MVVHLAGPYVELEDVLSRPFSPIEQPMLGPLKRVQAARWMVSEAQDAEVAAVAEARAAGATWDAIGDALLVDEHTARRLHRGSVDRINYRPDPEQGLLF